VPAFADTQNVVSPKIFDCRVPMLPIHKIIWHEWREKRVPERVPEPEAMVDPEQIRAYVMAYEWGGPTSALQLYHLTQLARMIRPGDTVVDLACGPGPLLLELAQLFPECQFIGVDLSEPMLASLREQAQTKNLKNIEARCEDIRVLDSLPPGSADVVISTSALHHLPNLESLRRTFDCASKLITHEGGIYFFDFGLLKSRNARRLMVAEVAKLAASVTAKDYQLSLDAAFPIEVVVRQAVEIFGDRVRVDASSFVDFFYFLRSTSDRAAASVAVQERLNAIRSSLNADMALELFMLRKLQRRMQ